MNETIFLEELKELVALESFSRDAVGTGKVAAWIKKRLDAAAWRTKLISVGKEVGPILRAEWGKGKTYDVLLLGHMDTVFPAGTAVERPFSTEGDDFKGPGASDMKCGDLFMVHLAEDLAREKSSGHVLLLFTPDEEISSVYSRPVIEGEARKAKAVLIMESARPNGDLVKERKGISKYRLIFEGIAAHAGVNPDQGASAVHECMRWGQQIVGLANPQKEQPSILAPLWEEPLLTWSRTTANASLTHASRMRQKGIASMKRFVPGPRRLLMTASKLWSRGE